jgi:HEAT repeat protein
MSNKLFIISSIILLLMGTAFEFAQEGEYDQEKNIEKLIANLGTRYWEKAADELVDIGEPAVEPLIKLLNIGSGRPSENANYVLARIGTPEALDAVVKALGNQKFDGRVRGNAAAVLGEVGSEEFIDPLIEALKTDGSWWVRHFAVGSLGKIGAEKVAGSLIVALNDENQYVRRAAVAELGKLKPEEAFLSLVYCLKDEDWQIRLQTTEILVEIGREIEEPLLEGLNDDSKWVKVGAAEVLGKMKSERAIIQLISLLEERDWMVRDEAAVALSRINSKGAVKALIDLLKHETIYIREEAAWVLGEMRSRDAVEFLIQALEDEDIGWMAAVSLGKIGDEQAIEHLKKKAGDQESRVGKAAAWALARMLSDES